eukprot:TRINITY_DN1843_c0_g2_i5.p1 TRINITY_DN1843_c0_g2~~TRINITY_DN1843_c0_g2_i5.p1  ORF type:complete len:163 (+),score=34.29 TRINITY_DN1843_c0_g2_i5:75-563(+)
MVQACKCVGPLTDLNAVLRNSRVKKVATVIPVVYSKRSEINFEFLGEVGRGNDEGSVLYEAEAKSPEENPVPESPERNGSILTMSVNELIEEETKSLARKRDELKEKIEQLKASLELEITSKTSVTYHNIKRGEAAFEGYSFTSMVFFIGIALFFGLLLGQH